MVQIAGGIIVNPDGKVAVVNQFGNSWSLPKGHIEKGESPLDAAIREIEEETGIPRTSLRFVRPLGSYIRSRISRDGKGEEPNAPRELHLFLFETDLTLALTPIDPENPEAIWADPQEVSGLLTHPKDKAFFDFIKDEVFSFEVARI
jgi:8-oxo-dGTP pyrophosphatase MutT (NUDIX family)